MAASIRLGTELLIYQASELKAELDRVLDSLADGADLSLDARDLADVDGAGLQLLALLRAALARRGCTLTWQGLNDDVAARIGDSGLGVAVGVPQGALAAGEAT